jgi:tight adherence protein C
VNVRALLTARRLVVAILATAFLALLGGASSARADEPLEVLEVRADSFPRVVVRLNTRMTDAEAPLPSELRPEQLRVLEDGQPQPSVDLYQIRSPLTPASLVLAIDVSGSMASQDRLPQAREAAKTFLNLLRPSDRAAVVSFNNQVTLRQDFTADRRLLARTIDGLTAQGNTRLYDALSMSVARVKSVRGNGSAVVLLTDGEDTESASGVEEGIATAAQAGVQVYTIGLGQEVKADVLQRIAQETGGRFYHAPRGEDLNYVFRLISQRLTAEYEVFWISRQPVVPGREVPVQISINAPGLSGAAAGFKYPNPNFLRFQPPSAVVSGVLPAVPSVAAPSLQAVTIAGLLAGLAAALLYAGFVLPRTRRHLATRLATYLGGGNGAELPLSLGSALGSRRARVSPLTDASARVAARLLPRRQLWRLRRMLIQAGLPRDHHLRLFLAAELALAALMIGVAYVLVRVRGFDERGPVVVIVLVAALATLGFYLPYLWLRRKIEQRRKALTRALPDALDLMAIGVSAGLSLDGAILEIVEKWENELTRELGQVLNEVRMGASRRQALFNLVERTQLEDLRLIVAALIQAEELGTNISETLAVQAEQLRIRRRQRAEELARKAPVKMLIPLVFMIFPALWVVILAPAALDVFKMFSDLAKSRG